MTTHKTAALKALFLGYSARTSPTGEYYVFNVVDKEGMTDVCRLDAIHKSRMPWLFEALDRKESIFAPVIRDLKRGYRIDLSAIADFDPGEQPGAPEGTGEKRASKRVPPKAKTRIQAYIDPWKLEAIEKLSAAEGYKTYSDWLRDIIDRVIDAATSMREGE